MTVGNYQATCEEQYSNFPEVISCLKQKVRSDWRYQNSSDSDLVRLYIAYADKLVDEVNKKTISEVDAKFYLAQFYAKLKNESENNEYESNHIKHISN